MKSLISSTPAQHMGEHISDVLALHAQEPVLLLLSGGSAFDVLPYINQTYIHNNITIGMVDERFTNDAQGNNYIRLQGTDFYAQAKERGAHFLESVPKEFEKHHEFATRMRTQLDQYCIQNPLKFSLGVFGIGEDGHTAGIFPTTAEEFERLYATEDLYTYVTQRTQPYPQRTTITPACIEEVLDEVVLYAVGKNKCDNILNYMYNRTFTQHEIPALIPASHPHSMLFTDCPSIEP